MIAWPALHHLRKRHGRLIDRTDIVTVSRIDHHARFISEKGELPFNDELDLIPTLYERQKRDLAFTVRDRQSRLNWRIDIETDTARRGTGKVQSALSRDGCPLGQVM
jgi:hypothetical protein